MIYTNTFGDGLLKAELDTSGEEAILKIEIDQAVYRAQHEKYAQEAQDMEEEQNVPNYEYDFHRREWHTVDFDEYAHNNMKIKIKELLRDAREWAKNKTKKKIRLDFRKE